MVGVKGFEPSTPWSQTRCANQAALHSEKPAVMVFLSVRFYPITADLSIEIDVISIFCYFCPNSIKPSVGELAVAKGFFAIRPAL